MGNITATTIKGIARTAEAKRKEFEERILAVKAMNHPVSNERPFVISFIGRFKTGKSSLINALLGAELLPTKATTATAVITRIFRGDRECAWLSKNGSRKQLSMEEAKNLILNYRVTDVHNPAEVIFELPIKWLPEDVELRDTPGMDDSAQDGALEAIALDALKDTDLCVCVYDASSIFSEKERNRTWTINEMLGGNLVYAVNCTNRLNSIQAVNDVEKTANTFFESMQYPGNGLGKCYMMCSAPAMIDLDGFDTWLKGIVMKKRIFRGGSYRMRNEMRQRRIHSQLEVVEKKNAEDAGICVQQLRTQYAEAEKYHEKILKEKKSAWEKKGKKQAEELQNVSDIAEEMLIDTSILEDSLSECISDKGWERKYAANSKKKSTEYFDMNYQTVCDCWDDFRELGSDFIEQTIELCDFPGPYFEVVKATSGKKIGGIIFGGLIGLLLGPIGVIIGVMIGAMIGSANSGKINCSVSNTTSYVNREVVPKLRVRFTRVVSDLQKRIKDKAEQEAKKCKSGLEEALSEANEEINCLAVCCNTVI